MGFEDNVEAFYVALAEDRLEAMCQALSNMRLEVQNDAAHGRERAARATTPEDDAREATAAAVREEMLGACELKAQGRQDQALEELRRACHTGATDIDRVLNAFYLCAELGAAPAATRDFGDCLAGIFRTQARAVLERVGVAKTTAAVNEHGYIERNFYVEALSELMTGATDIMNAVADVTPDAVLLRTILAPIHEISAEIALEIVQLYAVDARMTAWERRAIDQARRDPQAGDAPGGDIESDESLQMIDLFLDELSFIIRIIVSYGNFVGSLCKGLLDEAPGARGGGLGGFAAKTQELQGVYLILERFYLFQSTHKATEIAEVQVLEDDVFVSSIVEDVSFVLHKSFYRASQCVTYHTSLSIVIAVVDALESTFLPAIVNLPRRQFVIPTPSTQAPSTEDQDKDDGNNTGDVSFSELLLAAVDDDLTRSQQEEAKLIMAINSAFMGGEFVQNLEAKMREFSETTFPTETPLVECLPKPIHELRDAFHSIVDTEIQEVLARGINRRMEPLINRCVLEGTDYVLTTAQYDALGLHGSPLNKLIENEVMKNKILRRYQRALCSSPFEGLVEYLIRDLTKWIEGALVRFRKTFNDLGALQLEREVTAMLDRVQELVPDKSLRAAFTRLFQVVLILNLMQPADIADYADTLGQEFKMVELDTFLRMRVDFKPDEIRRAMESLNAAMRR